MLLQDRCPKWADDGECATNAGWMNTNCRRSCNSCTNVQSFTQVDYNCCTRTWPVFVTHSALDQGMLWLCAITEQCRFDAKDCVVLFRRWDMLCCRCVVLTCSSLNLTAKLSNCLHACLELGMGEDRSAERPWQICQGALGTF